MQVNVGDLQLDRRGRRVLDVPALEFPSGSVTAVFGPNGSGKTSLLRCIAGLERPRGTVTIAGTPVRRGDPRVSLAFQEPVFLRDTVRANLALGLDLRGVLRREHAARISRMADECGLAAVLDRPAGALSAGEAQRANLARTLALAAPVTLLDEPLSGFDRIGRVRMLEEIPALLASHAATAIIVTHDREEAFRLADRLVLLVGGRVAASGPAGVIYRSPPDAESARLLGYTVIGGSDGSIGFPPGGLRRGPGGITLRFEVLREVDMGNHRHLIGRISFGAASAVAELRLDGSDPADPPGTMLEVHPHQWVEFPVRLAPS